MFYKPKVIKKRKTVKYKKHPKIWASAKHFQHFSKMSNFLLYYK